MKASTNQSAANLNHPACHHQCIRQHKHNVLQRLDPQRQHDNQYGWLLQQSPIGNGKQPLRPKSALRVNVHRLPLSPAHIDRQLRQKPSQNTPFSNLTLGRKETSDLNLVTTRPKKV